MDLATAKAHAQALLLNTSMTLNGVPILAHCIEQGRDDDADAAVDYIEVEFAMADYPTVAYRTDTLVYNGITWRYPRTISVDGTRTRTVRFLDNPRNIHTRRQRG
jgi:hypothetical protein